MRVHARGGAASQCLSHMLGFLGRHRPSLKAFCEISDLVGTSNNSRLKSSDFQRCLTRFLSSLGQRDWKTEEEIEKKQIWVIKLLNCCHLGSPSPYHLLFCSSCPVRQSRDSQQCPWGGFCVWSHPAARARCDLEGTQHTEMEYAKGSQLQLWVPTAPLGAGAEALWAGHSKGTSWILVAFTRCSAQHQVTVGYNKPQSARGWQGRGIPRHWHHKPSALYLTLTCFSEKKF